MRKITESRHENGENEEQNHGPADSNEQDICKSHHHQRQQQPPQSPQAEKPVALLEEIFYISSKRNSLYRVRLTERGLSLQKESNCSPSKTEIIPVEDIIGCRCLRSKRRSAGSCACGSGASRGQPRLVDTSEQVLPHDEYDSSAYLYVYAYTLKKSKSSTKSSTKKKQQARRRERMTVTLRFRSFDRYEDNLREASRWRLALKCLVHKLPVPKTYMSPTHRNLDSLLSECPGEPKKLLVMLNPKSGPGRSRESFQRRVHPILSEADLTYDVFITRHSDYARDFVRTRDLSQWSGLVLVGGDGIVFEAINGLLQRPDWDVWTSGAVWPIAVIPCGSGNGLAKSIAHSKGEPYDQNPMLISSLSVVRRQTSRMDLVRIETRKQVLYSFLSVGWGLLADIDIESERLRAIGGQRFTVWSLARLIGLRTYRGTVSYLPREKLLTNGCGGGDDKIIQDNGITHSKSYGDQLDRYTNEMRESRSYDNGFAETGGTIHEAYDEDDYFDEVDGLDEQFMNDSLKLETESSEITSMRQRSDSFYSAISRKSTYFSTATDSMSSTYHSIQDLNITQDQIDSGSSNGSCSSKVMYGPSSNLPALTAPVPSDWTKIEGEFVMVQAAYQSHLSQDCFFAPQAKLADGIIWLLIIKAGISRTNLLQFLLGLSTGNHLNCPGVEMIPVKAFRIEPAEGTVGLLTVDGEKVDYGPLQAEVFSSLATVMCP
ncbi:hypothetical protein TKK_0006177 [Trichogramma kaykai]|uniref:DAGKc domain-containing protein n=1 Tax=Trichogramma kaykai TaxID=54128 RepID=A0ABD2XER6_9HYME